MTSLTSPAPVTSPPADVADLVLGLAQRAVSPEDRAAARLRVADTVFAAVVGGATPAGRSSARLAGDLLGRESLAGRMYRLVAAIRMTEIDDIDLRSCVTPGSLVVPTVLALAGAGMLDSDLDAVLNAVARGYEVALGLGEAMRGPYRLASGTWPSLAVGGVTAAAVASFLLGASDDVVGAAVTLAAEQSVAGNPRGNARELLLAGVAATGIGCALAVQRGFTVPVTSAGGRLGELLDARPQDVAHARIHRPAVKSFCSARQAMTAVSALRALLSDEPLTAELIDRIDVHVPAEYASMLRKPTVANRRDTLSSAAYQLALAVVEPAGLQDVARPVLRSDPAFRALMARVAVHAASDLSARYPDQWPARVRITTDAGACTLEATADSVPGEQELTAEGLRAKVTAFIPAVGLADVATELVERALNLADVTDLAALAAGLDEDSPITKEPRP